MIEVKNLTKYYKGSLGAAVKNASLTAMPGEITVLLGPNGAGKSTTMNIMTGCLSATSGDVSINGFDIFDEPIEAKKTIGYLPEQPPLYMEETPREYLRFVAEAKMISRDRIRDEINRVMEETQITDVADRLIKNLSKGYRQRVGIAQTLLGNPQVIILDEPTVGLDPRQIMEIRDLIKELGKTHTVILSSHILSEVQAVCQTILIISKGRLVACDTPENLERLFAGTTAVELVTEAGESEIPSIVRSVSGVREYDVQKRTDDCLVRVELEGNDARTACRELFFAFSKAGKAILQMSVVKASLEDIFLELTQEEKEEKAQ